MQILPRFRTKCNYHERLSELRAQKARLVTIEETAFSVYRGIYDRCANKAVEIDNEIFELTKEQQK